MLGLPFPGGPPIDRAAREGDPAAIAFPRGLTGPRDAPFDFSFSGLKTAVARWVEARQRAGEPVPVADVAASFQEAVADVLTAKAVRACREHGVDHLVLGGGVAANSRLRALAEERCAAAGIVLRVPEPAAVHRQRRDGRRARGRGWSRPASRRPSPISARTARCPSTTSAAERRLARAGSRRSSGR